MHGKVLFQGCRGFCQHYSALVFVAHGFGLAIFGFMLVEKSASLVENLGLSKARLQTKFLELLSGGELAPKQPPEFPTSGDLCRNSQLLRP